MAKILLSFFSGIRHDNEYKIGVFYEGLSNALKRNGNDVLQLVTSDFLPTPWGGNNKSSIYHKKYVTNSIKKFNPDLIISFNNSLVDGVEKAFDCPIIIWDSDSLKYFNNKNQLLKNKDRYIFFAFSSNGINDYKACGISNAYLIKTASEIFHEKLEKKYNISFIGSTFFNNQQLSLKYYHDKKTKDFNKKTHFLSASHRSLILNSLLKNGLAIFGTRDWLIYQNFNDLFSNSYKDLAVWSLAHNQDIYNRSNFSLNITHKQNISGMPFRVADILRSDSLLITEYKSDFFTDSQIKNNELDIFKKYTVYDSYIDVNEKIKYLEVNKSLLSELKQIQFDIGKLYSWDLRLKEIQQITNIKMLNNLDASPKDTSRNQVSRVKYKKDYYDFFMFILIKIFNFFKFKNKTNKKNNSDTWEFLRYFKYKIIKSIIIQQKLKKNDINYQKEYK